MAVPPAPQAWQCQRWWPAVEVKMLTGGCAAGLGSVVG